MNIAEDPKNVNVKQRKGKVVKRKRVKDEIKKHVEKEKCVENPAEKHVIDDKY